MITKAMPRLLDASLDSDILLISLVGAIYIEIISSFPRVISWDMKIAGELKRILCLITTSKFYIVLGKCLCCYGEGTKQYIIGYQCCIRSKLSYYFVVRSHQIKFVLGMANKLLRKLRYIFFQVSSSASLPSILQFNDCLHDQIV